jgi:hypothetical protein
MRCIGVVGLLMLWPSLALADEVVETKDGRRLLLRDNGTYEVAPSQGVRCKNLDDFQELDYRDRGDISALMNVMHARQLVCQVGDVKLRNPAGDFLLFYYHNRDKVEDGEIEFSRLSTSKQKHLHDNCSISYCRVVIYGMITGLYGEARMKLQATELEW